MANEFPALSGTIEDLAAAVEKGDRRALARAITLVESTRADHRAEADALLARLQSRVGTSLRLGISGAPGVGKSTFIEALGLFLIGRGHRPAVLAVDPSSPVSGGSILGDKTRMAALVRDDRAFVRPSPSRGALGGIAPRTRESVMVCEAAGFDVILVETVGVGQSETDVAGIVDHFILLIAPLGGDELQGINRGIVELADLVVVTKADGAWEAAARRAAMEYTSALTLLEARGREVLTCSALEGRGIEEIWQAIERRRGRPGMGDALAARRREQARAALWAEIDADVRTRLRGHPRAAALLAKLEPEVGAGAVTTGAAARAVLDALLTPEATPRRLTGRGKLP